MNQVILGIILCMTALILLHQNQWPLGLAAFVLGFILMNRKNRR